MMLFLMIYLLGGYYRWSITIIPSAVHLSTYIVFTVILPLMINTLLVHYLFYYFSIWKTDKPSFGYKDYYNNEYLDNHNIKPSDD